MKISYDNIEILSLTETQKKVIKNDISEDLFDDDMKRRIQHIILHKYEKCLERLKEEWMPKLQNRGIESIPLDNDAFAELVFQQEDYKSKKTRMLETKE